MSTPESRPPRVVLCTPCYGGQLLSLYVMALLQSLEVLRRHQVEVSVLFHPADSLVTRARDYLAAQFLLDSAATHLMFLDADVSWNPEAIAGLLSRDKDIVGGAYPKKAINWGKIDHFARQGKIDSRAFAADFVVDAIDDRLEFDGPTAPVAALGTGFMLIARRVLETLVEKHPDRAYRNQVGKVNGAPVPETCHALFAAEVDHDRGILLSEDYFFCKLARAAGFDIHLDRTCRLTHTGTYTFHGDFQHYLTGG